LKSRLLPGSVLYLIYALLLFFRKTQYELGPASLRDLYGVRWRCRSAPVARALAGCGQDDLGAPEVSPFHFGRVFGWIKSQNLRPRLAFFDCL
jgi:hypothetical protein